MFILLSLAAFNVFYHLGNFPIYSWDEARHGVSAYEMIKNRNFIVNTYRGKADYWNLKPPLSFWAIIAGYKIAGFNALGLRLFSAIFAMITIILVGIFVYKHYGKVATIFSSLILSTCTQFLINHSSRTGDADSLFVLLFTVAILSLLQWNENYTWLYVSGLAFSLAFLTKSWHAGNIAVIMGLYLAITGKFRKLSFKNWLILVMFMSLPILIWAGFRYQYDGLEFFKKMIMYDLMQRSNSSIEGHMGGVSYYFDIVSQFFNYWMLVLFAAIVFILLNKDFSLKSILASKRINFLLGICLWALIPFLLFTFAKTKVRWYILPIYPPLSIMIGVLISKIFLKGNWIIRVSAMILLLSVSLFYESEIYTYLNHPTANLKQSLINKVTNNQVTKGDSIFLYHLTGKTIWLQSEALTAELDDDLRVNNGNFTDFLKSNRALLLVPKNSYSQKLMQSNQLKIIANNKGGYLVEKSSMADKKGPA
ncbi:ArnT family glycosyltransferase [Neobacillus cucumis]|uniref:ArnT family glycosyltransferase n=1 Tax=Neobacillus cucumis TaxID=1740721 RepID=UPI00285342B4|nr:glycosyltransferase family 39 protein [Neobacillus cucumis]MDR4949352.1 glycosyltransferase family 39 protein [Neobacillus cucumis]